MRALQTTSPYLMLRTSERARKRDRVYTERFATLWVEEMIMYIRAARAR